MIGPSFFSSHVVTPRVVLFLCLCSLCCFPPVSHPLSNELKSFFFIFFFWSFLFFFGGAEEHVDKRSWNAWRLGRFWPSGGYPLKE